MLSCCRRRGCGCKRGRRRGFGRFVCRIDFATGLTAQQTGVSVDAFDCPILEWTAKYGEPDAMIFKAII